MSINHSVLLLVFLKSSGNILFSDWINMWQIFTGGVLLDSGSVARFGMGWDYIFKTLFLGVQATFKKFSFWYQDYWLYGSTLWWNFCLLWWCNLHGSISFINSVSTPLGIFFWCISSKHSEEEFDLLIPRLSNTCSS